MAAPELAPVEGAAVGAGPAAETGDADAAEAPPVDAVPVDAEVGTVDVGTGAAEVGTVPLEAAARPAVVADDPASGEGTETVPDAFSAMDCSTAESDTGEESVFAASSEPDRASFSADEMSPVGRSSPWFSVTSSPGFSPTWSPGFVSDSPTASSYVGRPSTSGSVTPLTPPP
ncbi:hypothetical protein AB0J90_25055 [Micromonospora sp. NPDC049523]|uniref:hypothetical protein n=1 Tax=Micromonospora sp. NPDC049523 TaxID=3155921 RepID=UPI0034394046